MSERLRDSVKQEIVAEIEWAVALHGEQTTLPDSVWCCIATEEMGEIAPWSTLHSLLTR